MLKLSPEAKQKTQSGEIVNLMSVDTERFSETVAWIGFIFEFFFTLTIAFGLLYYYLGPSSLAGLLFLIVFYPFIFIFSKLYSIAQDHLMSIKDERVKIIGEMISGIRIVKFFAWEEQFKKRIGLKRREELYFMKKSSIYSIIQNSWSKITLVLTFIVTYSTYLLLGNKLDLSIVFSGISIFSILEFPINMSSYWLSDAMNALVSANRIEDFLMLEEVQESNSIMDTSNISSAIEVQNGDFKWNEDKELLQDINLKIPKGSLVSVIGEVGAGKSSLLNALFGDMKKSNGEVFVNGSISYCNQNPWILNQSVKDNILFGNEYDEKRYKDVCKVCQLETDLQTFPNGDLTEIGENGINLSGGQCHRLSLARAVYSNSDILLLDSPLSAVDPSVASSLFNDCFKDFLKGKTIILVTHSLQFLQYSDHVVLLKNGKIELQGTYDEMIKNENSFKELIENTSSTNEKQKENSIQEPKSVEFQENDGQLVDEEKREKGSVSFKIFWNYLSGYGYLLLFLALFSGILTKSIEVFSTWWIGNFTQTSFSLKTFFGVFIATGLSSILIQFIESISFLFGSLKSSISMHENMLESVLKSPTSFFDSNPIGRILNRFSKDQFGVDTSLGPLLLIVYRYSVGFFLSLTIIMISSPPVIIALIPFLIIAYFLQAYYRVTYRETKRLEATSTSPIYSLFSSCIIGSSTIRAYSNQRLFILENEKRIDRNLKATWARFLISRWFSLRLEIASFVITSAVAYSTVFLRPYFNTTILALSITYSFGICDNLNWFFRFFVDFEAQLISCERIIQYTNLESEAPFEIKDKISSEWPLYGKISFENVKMRYRDNLDPVLKGVSFTVEPGEHIGIVGRTGSGKSSLIMTLFRMVEIESGSIKIDDIDTKEIGLKDLRSRIAIIPQTPTIFSGTIRSNLDPFELYQDHEIWEALSSVSMDKRVKNLENGLHQEISENGSNLSVGERQLLCLVRALLSNAKIIVLDEATSNVDLECDSIIQKTIREKFKTKTILTIAHRIDTIIDYDKILVLKDGIVQEYDAPKKLLENSKSIFSSFVQIKA